MDNLTPSMRRAVEQGATQTEDMEMSPMQMRAKMRKQRIDNLILKKKLDAALKKISQLEASRELAAELAKDSEGSCL